MSTKTTNEKLQMSKKQIVEQNKIEKQRQQIIDERKQQQTNVETNVENTIQQNNVFNIDEFNSMLSKSNVVVAKKLYDAKYTFKMCDVDFNMQNMTLTINNVCVNASQNHTLKFQFNDIKMCVYLKSKSFNCTKTHNVDFTSIVHYARATTRCTFTIDDENYIKKLNEINAI